jgi:hypothetical protein
MPILVVRDLEEHQLARTEGIQDTQRKCSDRRAEEAKMDINLCAP